MLETTSKRRTLTPAWGRLQHPVFRLEARRRTSSRVLETMQRGCLPSMLAAASVVAALILVLPLAPGFFYSLNEGVFLTLLLLMLGLVTLQAMVGMAANILMVAQAAPLISGEVELQSWGLLRATALSLREIILAKFAAVLYQLRETLLGLAAVRAASLITGLIGLGLIIHEAFYYEEESWRRLTRSGLWVLPAAALLLVILWYALQPVLNYLMNAALGLLASAMSRSRSRALAFALGARLFLWISGAMLNFAALYGLGFILIGNWLQPTYAPIEAFQGQPEPSFEAGVVVFSLVTLVYVLLLYAWQIGFVAAALAAAERRARRLGA
jgi:hypothetical protein